MPDALFDAALRRLFPEEAFEVDISKYIVDGLTPRLVIRPARSEDVAATLAVANDAGAAVIPWGAGEHMGLGMPPARYDLALDLRSLDRVIEYEPADLTVTVEAGMALSHLQEVLGERGQWLPLEPPLPESATIGGVLATNASGASRYRYGTARDLLIGITFALPSGELVKSGGRVVKNVAGYDLGKLQIGALGTLGVITQATFKLAPLPARIETIAIINDLDSVMSIWNRLLNTSLPIQSSVLAKTPGRDAWSLYVRVAAGDSAIERSVADIFRVAKGAVVAADNGGLERAAVGATSTASAEGVVIKASVLPTTLEPVLHSLAESNAFVAAYPTVGVALGSWSLSQARKQPMRDTISALRSLCVDVGQGSLVLERAPVELKREVGVWGEPRDDFELMRRLKAELDPKGILNPGRYLGGI